MTQTFLFIVFVTCTLVSGHVHNAIETEMFAIPISPDLFNWTYPDFDHQYRFHASLMGKPELPSWLRYIYSERHHSGFIFGTPPRGTKQPITVEVIGLNRQDFETRRVLLTLKVQPKENLARHEVELKIDNLNVEDLLDEYRMRRLKDILRTKLWIESSQDLYATFLASAIDLGARLPLKPSDGEGLVVRLGSSAPFSSELKRLREEVRPLSRLPSCPREYKRTTVERLFRDAGLTLDWCSFELYNTIYKERETLHLEYLTEIPNTSKISKSKALDTRDTWTAPSRNSLPSRSFAQQFVTAIVAPIILMSVAIASLTAIVCLYHSALAHKADMAMLRNYGNANTEQTQVADNMSYKSTGVSPNNSLARPYSPKSTTNLTGNYNRPQPPPYMGSATNILHQRKPGTEKTNPTISGLTPEHARALALEESLKLLNEANISSEFENLVPILKEPIVDLNDGSEDYVPIKSDTVVYGAIKRELDDIDVPDLAKFGIGGVVSPI